MYSIAWDTGIPETKLASQRTIHASAHDLMLSSITFTVVSEFKGFFKL